MVSQDHRGPPVTVALLDRSEEPDPGDSLELMDQPEVQDFRDLKVIPEPLEPQDQPASPGTTVQ